MQNSDSGTRLNPGDRVRVRHDPWRDDSLQARHADRRAAFNGKIVRVETIERDGDVLVSEGTDDGAWFNPAELSPIVTDADGPEVGGPIAPLDVLDAAVQQALAAARREAQGWHSAALLARGEAEEARDALRAAQLALRDATVHRESENQDAARQIRVLKGHLAAREDALADERGKLAAVRAAWDRCRTWWSPASEDERATLDAVDKALGGVASGLPCELTVNFSEWHGTAHAVPTSDREPRRWRLMFPMASPVAAAEQRNLVAPGRIKHDALIGGWIGRVVVVQRAPVVGAAIELEVVEWIEPKEAKPEREDCPRCVY